MTPRCFVARDHHKCTGDGNLRLTENSTCVMSGGCLSFQFSDTEIVEHNYNQ